MYTVQIWRREEHSLPDITSVSHDAAKHIAQTHAALGHTVRLIRDGEDYTEVYRPDGSVMCGPYAQTTLVKGA